MKGRAMTTTFGRRTAGSRPTQSGQAHWQTTSIPNSPASRQAEREYKDAHGASGLVKQLFSFSGRAKRLELWAIQIAASIMIQFVTVMSGLDGATPAVGGLMLILVLLTLLVLIVVTLAASVRRYHDRNKSGWWVLIVLVPLVGFIWQLVELGFLTGDEGPNPYG